MEEPVKAWKDDVSNLFYNVYQKAGVTLKKDMEPIRLSVEKKKYHFIVDWQIEDENQNSDSVNQPISFLGFY